MLILIEIITVRIGPFTLGQFYNNTVSTMFGITNMILKSHSQQSNKEYLTFTHKSGTPISIIRVVYSLIAYINMTSNKKKYLDDILETKYRLALSRFRTSSHSLFIETGRYDNTPRTERLCKTCNMNQIEDEYHFLLVCPEYRE